MPRITRRGMGFLLLTLFVYLAASQSRMGWLYLVTAAMLAVLLSSFIIPWVTLRCLTVTRSVARPDASDLARGAASEDEQLLIKLVLRSTLPCALVRISEHCGLDATENQRKLFFSWFIGRAGISLTYPVTCYKRGFHSLGPVSLESFGLSGLFSYRRELPVITSVKVLPWHWAARRAPRPGSRHGESLAALSRGNGVDIFGTREYRIADPLRAIHWRSTARRGRLIVKEFTRPEAPSLTVLLDSSAEYGSGRDTTLEYSVKVAASLAYLAHTEGRPIRLITSGVSDGPLTLADALEVLTKVHVTATAASLPTLLRSVAAEEDLVLLSPAASSKELAGYTGLGRQRLIRVAFINFQEDGSSRDPLTSVRGVVTISWAKGQPPSDVIPQIIAACGVPWTVM